MFKFDHNKENHYTTIGFGDYGCKALKILNSTRVFDNLESIYIPSNKTSKENFDTSIFTTNADGILLSIDIIDSLNELSQEHLLSLLSELKIKSLHSVVIMDELVSAPYSSSLFKKN